MDEETTRMLRRAMVKERLWLAFRDLTDRTHKTHAVDKFVKDALTLDRIYRNPLGKFGDRMFKRDEQASATEETLPAGLA